MTPMPTLRAHRRLIGNVAIVLAVVAIAAGPITAAFVNRASADRHTDAVDQANRVAGVDRAEFQRELAEAATARGVLSGRVDELSARLDALSARLNALDGHRDVASASTTGYLGRFVTTCYELSGTTASGRPVGPGVVAVDPAVVALGTHLRVVGVGDLIASDTGPAVRGRHLDIWRPSCSGYANPTVEVWALD